MKDDGNKVQNQRTPEKHWNCNRSTSSSDVGLSIVARTVVDITAWRAQQSRAVRAIDVGGYTIKGMRTSGIMNF
jgi:hypothetical protein